MRIKRTFEGTDVRDAKAALTIVVQQEDVTKGTRKDPHCCAFAQACKRLFKGSAVFYKTIAYITIPDAKGVPYITRYHLTHSATELVVAYDKTGKFPAGVGLNLIPPSQGQTLEGLSKYRRKWLRERAKTKVRRKLIRPREFDASVRNGSGMGMAAYHNGEEG